MVAILQAVSLAAMCVGGYLPGTEGASAAERQTQTAPYPQSKLIDALTWDWNTYRTAAPGSDLWPVTWAGDDNLYAAWGDGGGFGGTDSDGRVSMGFARIEGGPQEFQGHNVNGGKRAEQPASFPKRGKSAGLISQDGRLYATINLQDGPWPNVNHAVAWSTDQGRSWKICPWRFPKGTGQFLPERFLQFGKGGTGAPAALAGYVYLYGAKNTATNDSLYLARVRPEALLDQHGYEFFAGLGADDAVRWTQEFSLAQAFFTDRNGAAPAGMVYDPGLKRFLLSAYHTGPGQLGIFEARAPWGPWFTLAYYNDWGGMGADGEGLTCEFPQKWMSPDGLTLWAVFSVYGGSAHQGINAHDRFNLIKVSLKESPAQGSK